MHLVRLANTLLKDEESARDNRVQTLIYFAQTMHLLRYESAFMDAMISCVLNADNGRWDDELISFTGCPAPGIRKCCNAICCVDVITRLAQAYALLNNVLRRVSQICMLLIAKCVSNNFVNFCHCNYIVSDRMHQLRLFLYWIGRRHYVFALSVCLCVRVRAEVFYNLVLLFVVHREAEKKGPIFFCLHLIQYLSETGEFFPRTLVLRKVDL